MRKSLYVTLLILCVVTFSLLTVHCGKSEGDVAKNLLDTLNQNGMGLTFKADPAKAVVQAEGDRYRITYKPFDVNFNTSFYKDMVNAGQFKAADIPIGFGEVTFIYGPAEKYLEQVSLKGMNFKFDATEFINEPELPSSFNMDLDIGIKEMAFKDYDISVMLDAKGKTVIQLMGGLIRGTRKHTADAKGISYQLSFTTEEKKQVVINLAVDTVSGKQKNVSDIFVAFYKKGNELPDFAKALEAGEPIFEVAGDLSGFSASVKVDGKDVGGGSRGKTAFSWYLGPDDAKANYNFAAKWSMKDFKLNIPGKPDVEKFGSIEDMNMTFSIDAIGLDFCKSYAELIKKSMAAKTKEEKEALEKEQAAQGMKMMGDFFKSQPVIKMGLTPLKHYFGEINAEAEFKVISMMSYPGKATVNIPKVEEMIKKLTDENVISPTVGKSMAGMLKQFFVVDDGGNASLTFEMKADAPGQFFLNGKSMKK